MTERVKTIITYANKGCAGINCSTQCALSDDPICGDFGSCFYETDYFQRGDTLTYAIQQRCIAYIKEHPEEITQEDIVEVAL